MSAANDRVMGVESLKPTPTLLIELSKPEEIESYADNPNIPIPVSVKTPKGKSLNDMLPEGSGIFLCQNTTAYAVGGEEKDGNLAIQTKDLADTEDFMGIEDGRLETLGSLLLDAALIRAGLRNELARAGTLLYKDYRAYWFDHPEEREADHQLSKSHTTEYIANANKYGGVYSNACAKAAKLGEELGLDEKLLARMKNYYNAELSEITTVVTERLKDLVTFGHAPDESDLVRVFNPRTGKYIQLSWRRMHMDLLDMAEGRDLKHAPGTKPGESSNGGVNDTSLDNSNLNTRLTRIYEARFPPEPLGLDIEHTGNTILFAGLEGEELEITTADGSTRLSDFLPPGVKILDRHSPTEHFGYHSSNIPEYRHVVIDLVYINEKNIPQNMLVAILAHEMGHARAEPEKHLADISNADLEDLEKALSNKVENGVQISPELVTAGIKYLSGQMEDEAEAWDEGKIIATACGIDDLFYEYEQTHGLNSYFYSNMWNINKLLSKGKGVVDSDEYNVYNPHTHEYRKMTVSEIRQLVESLEFTSKSTTLFDIHNKTIPII